MEFVIAFIVGYWLGTSSEPLDLKETRKAWKEVQKSKEFQTLLAGGSDVAKQVLEHGTGTLVKEIASAASSKLTLWQRLRLFLVGDA